MKRFILCLGVVLFISLGTVRTTEAVSVRMVDGALCVQTEVQAKSSSLTANLLVDLGMSSALVIDQDMCTVLEIEPRGQLTVVLQPQGTLKQIDYFSRDLAFLSDFTSDNAQALNEIPVWGILGLGAFGENAVWLDIQQEKLEYGDIAHDSQEGITLSFTKTDSGYRLPVLPIPDYPLQAALTTRYFDTRFDATAAAIAGYPGGDFETCMMGGELDLRLYTAIRPEEDLHSQLGDADLLVGNSLWQNFEMVVDARASKLWLKPKDQFLTDLTEQDYFVARADEDVDAMEAYLQAHPDSRLAEEAAKTILHQRAAEVSTTRAVLERACDALCQSLDAKSAARELLDLTASCHADHVAYFLERAEQVAKGTTDAALLGRDIAVQRGRLALEAGDLPQAHLHLLSALFGQPDNPQYNYWMGRYYEAKAQPIRAWSRYFKGSLGQQAVEESIAAMERLSNDPNLREVFGMMDMQDFLEGHIPAFQPADWSKHWPHTGSVVIEAVMCVDNPETSMLNLALRALAAEGVPVLCYHVNLPAPDPLATPMGQAMVDRLALKNTPAVYMNEIAVPFEAADWESPETVLAALSRAVPEHALKAIDMDVTLETEDIVQVAVKGTASHAVSLRADATWLENPVLVHSANECWLHGPVVRGRIVLDKLAAEPGRLQGRFDRKALEKSVLDQARATEAEQNINFRNMAHFIDLRQSVVVVRLYDQNDKLIAVGNKAVEKE